MPQRLAADDFAANIMTCDGLAKAWTASLHMRVLNQHCGHSSGAQPGVMAVTAPRFCRAARTFMIATQFKLSLPHDFSTHTLATQ